VQLGYCYERGIGTQADPQEAFKWYERAAQDGDEVGCNNLGYCYEQGLGVQADQEEAVRWYQAAVDRGMPLACKNLAAHYEEGSGVPKDLARAEELYSRAAQAGVKGAQERLDRLRGEPVQTTQAEQRKRFGWRGLAGVSVLFTMLFGAILTSPDIGHDWPTFLILTVVFALLGGFCMKKAPPPRRVGHSGCCAPRSAWCCLCLPHCACSCSSIRAMCGTIRSCGSRQAPRSAAQDCWPSGIKGKIRQKKAGALCSGLLE